MPVAIVVQGAGVIPAVIYTDHSSELLDRLRALSGASALDNEDEARLWLQGLPAPSGWFNTIAEAKAHLSRSSEIPPILPGQKVRDARNALGLSRVKFGEAVGINGNSNTVNKAVSEIEIEAPHRTTGRKRVLNPESTRRLFALMAEHNLSQLLE